jgi:large subunit ribosomal protein L9
MASHIRVVLQEDVHNLGAGGEIVRVRPGYARNYLIPRGLAAPATAGNVARVEDLKRLAEAKSAEILAQAQALKAKLDKTSVKLERAVGEDSKMYGSVTSKDIEEAFAKLGLVIDRRKVSLGEPIKELGLHEVPVKLHASVEGVLRVEVVKPTS